MVAVTVLVVGASVAGVAAVRALRRREYDGDIVMIEAEFRMPYDKPPVSKQMLTDDHDGTDVALLTTSDIADLRVDLRLATSATALNLDDRTVAVSPGGSIAFDQLIIATGARARPNPWRADLGGVHTLRTADDAIAVRHNLRLARNVVSVGGGFIGQEVAAAARSLGCAVTIVETQDRMLLQTLGPHVAGEVEDLHRRQGVQVITGTSVASIEGSTRVSAVILEDGSRLPADLVVVGIGAVPAIEWLAGHRFCGPNGIECDHDMRVVGTEGCYAVGDLARWRHPHHGAPVRIEHWTNANETAEIAAAAITSGERPRTQPPYVWSDQYGRRMQLVGRPGAARRCFLRPSGPATTAAAAYADDDDRIVGGFVVDEPRLMMRIRKAVARRSSVADFDPHAVGLPKELTW